MAGRGLVTNSPSTISATSGSGTAHISAGDLVGEYPVVQYVAPDGTQIDLLSRFGTAFAFDDLRGSVHTYGEVEVMVAAPETLYAMKRDTIRLQDKADAQKLKEKFGLKD